MARFLLGEMKTMNKTEFMDVLYESPIIAAIRDAEYLEVALTSECRVLFFMCGTLCTIGELTQRAREAGKLVFVHLDLIDGLSNQNTAAIDFLLKHASVDGIISTKASMIAYAKKMNLLTIQRYFLLDSMSLNNLMNLSSGAADAIEALPAVLPKVFRKILKERNLCLIAGGLISDKEDIVSVLNAGAIAVSTTNEALWMA